ETWTDDYTGEPVIADNQNIVVTSDSNLRKAQEALGIRTITRNAGSDPEETTSRPAEGGLGIIKSDYARHRLTAWYQTTAGGGLSASPAWTAAKGNWLIGNLPRAFGWATEWDLETLERSSPDTWEYFNQEIVLLIKYLWKVTPVVKNPRVVVKNTP